MPKPPSKPPKPAPPAERLAAALEHGVTVVGHVCTGKPKNAGQVVQQSLGSGTFTAKGGTFTIRNQGRAECVAVVWEGDVVRDTTDQLPMDVSEGQQFDFGPLSLRKTK